MATTFYSGTAGRVTYGSNTAIAGLNKWTGRVTTAVIPTPHFEVTADGDSNYFTPKSLKGWSEGEFEVSGFFNGDTTNSTDIFIQGATLTMDFLFDKTSTFGILDVVVTVTEVSYTVDAVNQAAGFTAKVVAQGVVPRP